MSKSRRKVPRRAPLATVLKEHTAIKRKGPYKEDISENEEIDTTMDETVLKKISELVNETEKDCLASEADEEDLVSQDDDDEAKKVNFLLEEIPEPTEMRLEASYCTLADLIFEQMEKKKREEAQAAKMALFSTTTLETFVKVSKFLSNYRSGTLPRAVQLIPLLKNWMDVLWLTEPTNWSANAMYKMTKLFLIKLPEKQIQTYLQFVLLPAVLTALDKHKRLNGHLYNALRESLYRATAWIRGIFFPTLFDENCSYKQAIIVCSILSSRSVPAVAAGAALVVLTKHEPQSNVISYAIIRILNKGHKLPIPVVTAIYEYFKQSLGEKNDKSVIWQQSLLTFVQKWKNTDSEIRYQIPLSLKDNARNSERIVPRKFSARMSGKGKVLGKTPGRPRLSARVTRSEKSGLLFPVGRIYRHIKEGRYSDRIGVGGAIYLTAVLEYLATEVIELAGERAKELNKLRITPQHILYAIKSDAELEQIARNVVFASSGLVPQAELAAAPSRSIRKSRATASVVISNHPHQGITNVQPEDEEHAPQES